MELERDTSATGRENANILWLKCACGRRVRAKRHLIGKRIRCRNCGAALRITDSARTANANDDAATVTLRFRQLAETLRATPPALEFVPRSSLSRQKYKQLMKIVSRADFSIPESTFQFRDAVKEIGQAGDARAVAEICERLTGAPLSARITAATALGQIGDPHAVPRLVEMLDEPDPDLRRAVISALGRIRDSRAVRALLQLGVDEPRLKHLASEAVQAIGDEAAAILVEVLDEDDSVLSLDAVALLGRLKSAHGVKALLRIAETHSAVFRAQAVESLGRIGDRRAAAVLATLLQDPVTAVRRNAAAALQRIADPSSLRALLSALDDEDLQVQCFAAAALGEIGDERAAGQLSKLLTTCDSHLRVVVAEALGKIGDERAAEPLLQLLNSDSEELLLKAMGAIKKIHAPRAVEALTSLLYHSTPAVRQRAADTLGTMGDAVVAEHLEQLLYNDRNVEVRVAAAKSLGEIGDPAAVDVLQDALRDEFPVRCRAITSLGMIGDEAALPPLLAMLREPVPEVRYHAARALAELNHPHAVGPLEALLEAEDHSLVRRGVEKSLEKLGETHGSTRPPGKRRKKKPRVSIKKMAAALTPAPIAYLIPHTPQRRRIVGGILASPLVVVGLSLLAWALSPQDRVVPRGRVTSLAFTADGNTLAVGRSFGMIEFWQLQTGEYDGNLITDVRSIDKLAAGSGKDALLYCSEKTLRLSSAEGEPVDLPGTHQPPIDSAVATRDGKTIVTWSRRDGMVTVWNIDTATATAAFRVDRADGWQAFAIDSHAAQIAIGNDKGQVVVLDTNGIQLHTFEGSQNKVGGVAFSAEDSLLAAAIKEHGIVIWDLKTKDQVAVIKDTSAVDYQFLKFLGGGRKLLSVRGGRAEIWDEAAQKSTPLPEIPADVVDVFGVSFDGRWLAMSGSGDSQVWLIDTTTGERKMTFDRH